MSKFNYYIKVKAPGKKRWSFLLGLCATTDIQADANMFTTYGIAFQVAKEIVELNPGFQAKILDLSLKTCTNGVTKDMNKTSPYHYEKYNELRSKLVKTDIPFQARLFYAMEKADLANLNQLELAFPGVYDEFKKRFNSPDGKIEGDI